MIPVVDGQKCTGCGECVDICPPEAITVENEVAVIAERFCEECGECADACPEGAITLPRV